MEDASGTGAPTSGTGERPGAYAARRAAAIACLVEVVALVVLCGFYALEMAQGQADDDVRAVMSIVLMLVFGALLAVLARGWLGTADWPQTPTIVWNVLLLPVAWTVLQAGQTVAGVAVVLVAALSIWAALAAGRRSDDADAEASDPT